VEGPPNVYQAVIAIGLYKPDPVSHAKRVKKYEAEAEATASFVLDFGSENIVPSAPEIDSTEAWWHRRPYAERKSQLRVAPLSCGGHLKVSFTKPVQFPADAIEAIESQNLVNVTFWPSIYDIEDEDGEFTEIKEWSIKEISEYGMMLKIVFENPNMLSYSIHEPDLIKLDINLKSLSTDGSSDELFGNYAKAVPLQYPN